jgi:DNA-binding MarR family transcriptional regulator
MSQLSKELMVSNGNITGVVDRLEKNDLVVRTRPKHDRRVQYIELTDTGKNEFKRMARQHERWIDELFSGMSVEDMQRMQKLLIKTRESVSMTLSPDQLKGKNGK